MKNKKVLRLLLLILFGIGSLTSAQDSLKIIILSDEVGSLLDAEEKKEYDVMPKFGDEFIHAFFYLDKDEKYYFKVRLKTGNSFKDTVLTIAYNSVKSIAMRIQYKENIEKGNSDFNINDVQLKFEDGETARNLIKVSSSRIPLAIPLAGTNSDYSQFVKKDLELGLGIGIIFNTYNFEDLSPIFYTIAKNVVRYPNAVNESDFTINSFPIFSFSSIFIIKNRFLGEIEYALGGTSSASSSLDYNSFSLSFSYLFLLSENLSPYFSIGYSGFNFNAVQNYGLPINTDYEGTLESISLEGAGKGVKLSIGAIYKIPNFASINIFGSYRFVSPIEVKNDYQSIINYDMSFDMKGYEIGLKILFRQ